MLSLREASGRRWPGLRPKVVAVNALRVVWVLAVLWCELGAFFWSVAFCRWPKQSGSTSLHVLLVADPQVPRPYKAWVPSFTSLKRHIVNHNLRKSWIAVKALRPQAVVFLGDMLRHGSNVKGMTEYGDYFAQFQSIFSLDPRVATFFIPGNRDVGLGSSRTFSAHARDRFEAYFGPANQLVFLGNHTLALLDAPALVEEDYRRHGAQAKFADWLGVDGGSIEFVKSVATNLPVVLFTHIPLFRPDGASCGHLREHSNIRRGVGRGYQSLLGKETSKFLLEKISPAVIFSADDQDYCEHLHNVSGENVDMHPVREVTVKSFSTATRLKRPGFQLLSLFSPPDLAWTQPSYADAPCLLPNQSKLYTHGYAPLLFGSILILLFLNLRRPRSLHLYNDHIWHDSSTLRPHEESSPDPSPITPSPPVSPIHFKSSHAHPTGLRSASTLIPDVFSSQPPTPLGGNPLLTSSFQPSPQPSSLEDDGAQELFIWPGQTSTPKPSPYLEGGSQEVDSSHFLPSPGAFPAVTSKKSIWLPKFGSRGRLTARPRHFSALFRPFHLAGHMLFYGGPRRAHSWHGRFLQDAVHVALLPALVYAVIALWLAR